MKDEMKDEMKTVDVIIRKITKISFTCECGIFNSHDIIGDEKPETVVCRCGVKLKTNDIVTFNGEKL